MSTSPDPDIHCKRIFLNDIDKDNPQLFHAAYYHETQHDVHRKMYIKYFQQWKKKFSKSKSPKAFLTWYRENYAKTFTQESSLVEEAHTRLTGTNFTETFAHLDTLKWLSKQKGTKDDTLKSRYYTFSKYASNIADGQNLVISEFVKLYSKFPGPQKAVLLDAASVETKGSDEAIRITTFNKKLLEKIKSK